MARSRNIKPSIFKNEILGQADPFLTLLFESLWCLADREGRLEDRPLRIKAETFPYREGLDINGYLTDLERMLFIRRYVVGGLRIIQVVNFTKHQSPHKTEKASELPEEPEQKQEERELPVIAPLENGNLTEGAALIPDSFNLIPDSRIPDLPIPDSNTVTPKPSPSALPDWMPVDAWNDYLDHRKAKRAKSTKRGIELMIEELEGWNQKGHSIEDILNTSIKKGWTGLFEPRRSDSKPVSLEESGWLPPEEREYEPIDSTAERVDD